MILNGVEISIGVTVWSLWGNGYINVSDLRSTLHALDDNITEDELDEMNAEIDTDGSGTVDFDDFMEMMSGE
ncbi:calmodulin [Aphelenchoides avenae]|nr:calmodulin [Aphelenchus avenae]